MRKFAVVSILCLSLAACAGDGEFRAGINGAGLVGPPGPQGAQGEAGAQGSQGQAGVQGGIGPHGEVGQAGLQGPAGPSGPQGQAGSDGDDAVPSVPGIPGVPGLPGAPAVPQELVDSNGSLRGGLGITGNGGLVSNILGNDPTTGPTEDALGQDNTVDHFLGGPPNATEQGVVPALASSLAGTNDTAVLGNGVGLTGTGGLSQDLLGSDVVGPLLGNSGVISDNISGGSDTLLGTLLQENGPQTPVQNVLPTVPTEVVGAALNQVPGLGVLGSGGLTEDVLGPHPDGNLISTESGAGRVLGTGSDGTFGSTLNTDSPPLAVVGQTGSDALNSLAGNNDPLLGDVAGNLPGDVPVPGDLPLPGDLPVPGDLPTGDLPTVVSELVSGVTEGNPLGGDVVGGDVIGGTVDQVLNLDTGGVVETATGAVDTVTSLADLGGITGGDLPVDVGGSLPDLGGVLGGGPEQSPVGGDLLGGLLGGQGGGAGGGAANPESRAFLRGGR